MRIAALPIALLLAACSGGGGSGPAAPPTAIVEKYLTTTDVESVIARAAAEAKARNLAAHISVVDRVGNVLAIFRMTGAADTAIIGSGLGVVGGFEGAEVPARAAVISKAVTAAYLSSNGNAFTTRTASQIVQEHFNPQENQQPSGPLYGVQFSQLPCSDVMQTTLSGQIGPRSSPLGLSADPGAVPLYKEGVLVGAVAAEVDGRYGIDRDITNVDSSPEEAIAVAGSFGMEAPADIRGDRITADGRTFRFTDPVSFASNPATPPAYASLDGGLVMLYPFMFGASVVRGAEFGSAASGTRGASSQPEAPFILVDATDANKFPVRAGLDGKLSAAEVDMILAEAVAIARRARGQIRRPLGSIAEVSITVVDTRGAILGLIRTADAPIFGLDVAVQKARTAAFFSGDVADAFDGDFVASPVYQPSNIQSLLRNYLPATTTFLGDPSAFGGAKAWSARAIGNLHRPYFPDGIAGTPNGPLSTPITSWSPFNVGLQEDLVYNQILRGLGGDISKNCVARAASGRIDHVTGFPELANGIQVFPGSVPIYRGNELVGAVGVSGDGVDQDDMIAFLGLANAGRKLATGIGNAPAAIRADTLTPMGTRLRYVQCPQSPFNDSTEQNVCSGL